MSNLATPSPVPRKPRRLRYWLAAFVLMFVAPPFAYRIFSQWMLDRELAQLYREMDADDPNWRWDDLIASLPTLSHDENLVAQGTKLSKKFSSFQPGLYREIYDPKLALSVRRPFLLPNALLPEEADQRLRDMLAKLDPAIRDACRKLGTLKGGRPSGTKDMVDYAPLAPEDAPLAATCRSGSGKKVTGAIAMVRPLAM